MRGPPLVLLTSLSATLLGGCDGDRICTQRPCGTTELHLSVPWKILESQKGQIRLCLQDACSTAPVWVPPTEPNGAGTWVGRFSGALKVSGWLTAQPFVPGSDLRYDLQVDVAIPEAVADGDRWELRVSDPQTGGEAVQVWTAAYFDARPNGPGCPPVCKAPSLRPL